MPEMNYLFSERREKREAAKNLIYTNDSMKLITMMLISSCRNVNINFIKFLYFVTRSIDRIEVIADGSHRLDRSERNDLNFNNKSIAWDKIVGQLEITSLLRPLPPFFSPGCRMKGASENEGEGSRVGTLAMFCWHWRTTTKPLLASASVI